MHRDWRRIAVAASRASRADRRLTPPTRRALVGCAAAILAFAGAVPVLAAELTIAEVEEASEVGRRAAVSLLHGGDRRSFGAALATDAIAAGALGEDVWRRLSVRQRGLVASVILDRFHEALVPPAGVPADIAWSAARPEGDGVALFLGLRYPTGVLKTRWSLARLASGWKVRDVFLSDPGISLAAEAMRPFGRDNVRRRSPVREAWGAAFPRALGLLAILAIVLVLARRLSPSARAILVWTAVAPAVLFALDGFFAVRRALSEPYRVPEVLAPTPWSVAERQALAAQREGRLDAARQSWERAVAAGAPAAAAEYRVGVALASAGRREEARAVFLRALSRSPSAPGAAKELGLIALAEGKSAEAYDLLKRYVASAGPDPDALSALAVAATNVGEKTEAVESIEGARLMLADHWKSARLQSKVLARAGDAAGAVKSLRELEPDVELDREALRSDPAYLPIATDPAWVAFLSETPTPARTPAP